MHEQHAQRHQRQCKRGVAQLDPLCRVGAKLQVRELLETRRGHRAGLTALSGGSAVLVDAVRAARCQLAFRWSSGRAPPAFTSPSEKLVWMSFTLGSFSSVLMEKRENASRSVAITCSSKVPVPEM
jgi:hypothetical protein